MTKNEFYNKWLETFGAGISKSDIEKYVQSTGNCIWHVFSWDLLDGNMYLIDKDAKEAFDKVDKIGASYIDWYESDHTEGLTSDMNFSDALDEFIEVYVVGKDFDWTYIKTHEVEFGPYFLKLNVEQTG